MSQPEQKPGRSKQDYATPDMFIDAVKRRLAIDSFLWDFAADANNAKADQWWGEEHDSLSMTVDEWGDKCDGGWGWLNPPFSKIGPWAKKCAAVAAETNGKIAFLVPAAVGSNWYRDFVHRAHARVLFLNGRIPFMPDKPKWLYPKDCILVLYCLGFQGSDVWTWNKRCDHKFVDSTRCLKCGWTPTAESATTTNAVDPSAQPQESGPRA